MIGFGVVGTLFPALFGGADFPERFRLDQAEVGGRVVNEVTQEPFPRSPFRLRSR